MEDDPLFNLDTVRDFINSRGGKVSNHDLVTHFKTFLNDPRKKDTNRQKFKSYVNTLSSVKLDTSGEKLLVLKKKYRGDTLAEAAPKKQKHKEKLEVKKQKVKDDSAWRVDEPTPEGAEDSSSSSKPESGGGLLESFLAATAAFSGDQADDESNMSSAPDGVAGNLSMDDSEAPEDIEIISGAADFRLLAADSMVTIDHPSANQASTTETPEKGAPESPVSSEPIETAEISPISLEEPMESSTDDVPVSVHLPEPIMVIAPEPEEAAVPVPTQVEIQVEEPMEAEEAEVLSPIATEPPADGEDNDVTPPLPVPTGPRAVPLSVKDRAKHLNKISSESDLGASIIGKKPSPSKDDDDTTSQSNMAISLDETERQWMLSSAAADYHPMAKLLLTHPHLVKRKDFMSGFTALHWAAKHGKLEVIKLLCGTTGVGVNVRSHGGYTPLHLAAMHGHEDVIEILVYAYSADTTMRDYSGKKAKQYLRNSASTRSQQLLQARRLSANVGGNTNLPMQGQFQRVGSYSSKIKTAGHFGIVAAPNIRSSWAAPTGSDRSGTPSPSPSPRESPRPSPRQSPASDRKASGDMDEELMPPPREVPRRKRRNKQGREDKENNSDSELMRAGSESELTRLPPQNFLRDTSV